MGFQFKANASADKPIDYSPVPEDDYLFRVKEVPAHSITKTNRDMLTFQLVVDEGEYSGKKVRHNLVFIPEFENNEPQKGHGMTIRALKAFGMSYDGDLEIEPSDYLDKVVRAHVKIVKEPYIDKKTSEKKIASKNEIAWFVVDDDGSQVAPASKSKVDADVEEVPF